jgi:hypothetical protein
MALHRSLTATPPNIPRADVPRRRPPRIAAGALERDCLLRGDVRRCAHPPAIAPVRVVFSLHAVLIWQAFLCGIVVCLVRRAHAAPRSLSARCADGWESRWAQSTAKEGLGEFVAADGT